MITRLDRDVGRLLDALAATGQDRDTLVLFTSDNGPHREGGHSPAFFESSGPLRGIKRDLYEGGIRVPALAWWPGRIAPGSVSDHVWAFWDFLPTAAELCGAPPPEATDGISFLPALEGRPQQRHRYLYWEFHERVFRQAIRQDNWKAVRADAGSPLELYDLSTDVSERYNVAGKNPDIVRRLEPLFASARTESAEWPVRR
jgi:arylsulfatase A-like enzyme